MTDRPQHPDTDQVDQPIARQVGVSAMGEIVAFSLAIGAVYVSERMLPKQTEALVTGLAAGMAKWRGASVASQKICAKKILDVGIMNMAGVTGMAAQFGIRRAQQKESEKTSFWYETGRLATGRLIGTFTAITTLALMETRTPKAMRALEVGVAKGLGTGGRFSELLVSDTVQTAGALAGNVPAQLLYDRLVNPERKDKHAVR